ncbi:phage tail protein I [Streptomyces sp. NPDC005529]|uniref:phage tail protein I n=1 Tax=unclassified Streptomyces TaxID=2593676 RepID=UPI0033B330BC
MRGIIPGLATPHPLGSLLPAVYQEDPFAMRWVAGLDDVLAPVISTLDCLDAYFDPHYAPSDFLEWLASWVGITINSDWPADRARRALARAVQLHRTRGTVAGLRDYVEVLTGGTVEIADNGGAAWSTSPDTPLPGEDTPRLAIRLSVPSHESVNIAVLEDLITAAKPAHVMHRLEVIAA